jgi:hypothetical protein
MYANLRVTINDPDVGHEEVIHAHRIVCEPDEQPVIYLDATDEDGKSDPDAEQEYRTLSPDSTMRVEAEF